MPRKAAGLTAKKVQTAKPGRYGDGGGLYLLVRSQDAKSWLFRYTRDGKMREMGLGSATGGVTLAEARAKAADLLKLTRGGIDPLAQREAEAAKAAVQSTTFRDAAEQYLAAHEPSWKSEKHRGQWRQALHDHAFPHIGGLPVADVSTDHVLTVLQPLWLAKPSTANRLRGRLEAVLDYARSRGWRLGENPARWRGHVANMLPKRSKVAPVEHYPALPWAEVGTFMATLHARSGLSARALEFLILTAARSGEVLGATWGEIDLTAAVWTVPAQRMKSGKEHRVPLAPAAVALLHGLLPLREPTLGDWVFPGKIRHPLSNMALTMVLRHMKRTDLTVHGFRSTFRDWAAETTDYAREVVEAALAHAVGNQTEAAYRRGDLFDKRRKLMNDWASYCADGTNP